jgi:nitrogen-specific signal transduction histidine kinase
MAAIPPFAESPNALPSLALEAAPLPMATVEGATHIVRYGNPAFCRLMGKTMGQLVGIPISELLPERDICVSLIDRVFRTGKSLNHTEKDTSKTHPVFWSYTMWPFWRTNCSWAS